MLGWLLLAGQAFAQSTDPAIQRGIGWLQGQIDASGQLASEATSPALPMQARSETATTLKALSTPPPAALYSAIDGITPDTTEYLARKALARQSVGSADAPLLDALVQTQNQDGGFGAAAGFQSNPLDTAYALMALTATRANTTATIQALIWLTGNQQASGAWFLQPDSDAVVTTALVTQALAAYSQYASVQTALIKAGPWLLAQRNAATQTYPTMLDNALALQALATQTAQSAVLDPLAAALKASQQPNGSWSDDPYLTALALRALAFQAQPPSLPTTDATLSGVIRDRNGNPLQNVTVSVRTASAVTDASGAYQITGINPGTATVTATLSGYQTATTSVTFVAGNSYLFSPTLYTASVTPPATSLQGIVVSGTGTAIQGASVMLDGGATVMTDASGKFVFTNQAAGAFTLTISATGYTSVKVTGSLVAGVNDIGKIELPPLPPLPTDATLGGVIKDSNGNPLQNVIVAVGTASTVTDASGAYQITGLSSGAATVTASLSGYQTVTANVTFVAGNSYLFSPTLYAASATPPATTSLQGIVVNGTGAAIQGASVTLDGGATVMTDASGKFAFNNQAAGAFTLTISAAGYASATVTGPLVAGVNDIGKIALPSLPPLPTDATLSGVIKDNNGNPLQNVTVSVRTASAVTDASGAYQITGINPGTATVTATLSGYQTATTSVTFVAGNSYLFSPTLYTASVTPPATSLQGVVVSGTGTAIQGASVMLGSGAAVGTDASGKFVFNNQAAGAFTLTISATGYTSVKVTGSLVAGVNDIGKIVLTASPSLLVMDATLNGIIKSSNGNPLQNVTVVVGAASAVTDASGAYQITGLSSGAATVTASLSGYQTVTANITLVAGSSYQFSPTLYATGVTPPATSLQGIIVNRTGAAVPGVSVTLGGGATVTTDANGKFAFNNQAADAFTLTISAAGYASITMTGSLAAGVNDIGKIVLATQVPVITCTADPASVFNTGSNGSGGILPGGATDLRWQVTNPGLVNGTLNAGNYNAVPDSYWIPAIVLGNPSAYRPNLPNAAWISQVPSAIQIPSGNVDVFYRLQFILDPSVNLATFQLNMDFWADNSVHEVWINGLAQSGLHGVGTLPQSPTSPYNSVNFSTSSPLTTYTFTQGWQTGLNTFIVDVKTAPGLVGLLAQFRGNQTCIPPLSNIQIAVATDQPAYPANTDALLTGTATNQSAAAAPLKMFLQVVDEQGQEVTRFATQTLGTVAAGASVSRTETWNTGTYAAGAYTLIGTLLDEYGRVVDIATTPLAITPAGAAGTPAATLTVNTDKAQYQPNDRVRIGNLLRNLTANAAFDDARVELKVFDPSSTEIFSYTHTVGQLPAGALRTLEAAQPLRDAALGTYTVQATLIGSGQNLKRLPTQQKAYSTNVQLATATASYTVIAPAPTGGPVVIPSSAPAPIPALGTPALALMGLLIMLAAGRPRRRCATIAPNIQTPNAGADR